MTYNNDGPMFVTFYQAWRFVASVVPLISLAAALSAQTPIGAGEMRLHASPYSPSPSPAVIRTQVELVEVPAVVRDSKGVAIPGLKREDFEIFDAGKKREISAFSVETFPRAGAFEAAPSAAPGNASSPAVAPQPNSESRRRYIALVLDDLNTDFASLVYGKTAAKKFVSEALAPGDLVAIFTTALAQTVEFTNDVPELRRAIEAVEPHARYSDELHQCLVIQAYEAYLIANHLDNDLLNAKAAQFDQCQHINDHQAAVRAVEAMAEAIWENAGANTAATMRAIASVVSAVGKMPGERLVLLTSAGFLAEGQERELQALSTAALHAGVIVSAAQPMGLHAMIPSGDASRPSPSPLMQGRGVQVAEIRVQSRVQDAKDDPLAMLASSTGGQFFHNNNDLALGLRRLGALPEVMYVLGFAPNDVVQDGKYHPLKVRLTGGRHDTVEARIGYYAPPRDAPAKEAPAVGQSRPPDRDRLLMSTDSPSGIAARITAEPGTSDTGPRVVAKAWIDVSRLNFERKKDRRTQKLTVIAALLDGAGNFVVGRQAVADLALKAPSFEALSATGLTVSLSLHAPPGAYNLRVLIQDTFTGKMTAVSNPVELH